MTLDKGGSKWALPARPASSQPSARVASERILRVRALMVFLFAADFFQNAVQRSGIKDLLKAYGARFEQP
jgi:hypothetical protein